MAGKPLYTLLTAPDLIVHAEEHRPHDGLEREFKSFNRLEGDVCTGRSKKILRSQCEQSFYGKVGPFGWRFGR